MSGIDCIKHGEVGGFRDTDGKLKCSVCAEERKAQAKKNTDKAKSSEKAKKIMDDLFNKEKMKEYRGNRENDVLEMFRDVLENQLNHEQQKK